MEGARDLMLIKLLMLKKIVSGIFSAYNFSNLS